MDNTIWVIAHPTKGILHGVGRNASDAWENAMLLLYDPSYQKQGRQDMHRKGWRAKSAHITVKA